MKKYESTRNGSIAEVIMTNSKEVILLTAEGEQKAITPATLKRWWREIPEVEIDDAPTGRPSVEALEEEAQTLTAVPFEEDPAPEVEAEETPAPEVKTKKAKKAKKEKVAKEPEEDKPDAMEMKVFLEEMAEAAGAEVFIPSVKSFRSLKVGGKMYMAYTFNKKTLTLWMRSKAITGITDYKTMNHMFDARVSFTDNDVKSRLLITKLHKACLENQIEKNDSKNEAKEAKRTKKTK